MLEIKGSGGSSKGSGGSTYSAKEEPNNLECESIARITDLIGEGEIGGLVNGGQSIFFDDTSLMNADGSYNFKGARYWERVGLPDQDPLPFDEIESEASVGVVVTAASGGVVRTIDSGDVDAVRISLSLNALLQQHTDDGDVVGTTVNLAIDVQPSGGSWIVATLVEIKGKTNDAYMRSVTIDRWKERFGEGPWNVRVRRITEDAETLNISDEVSWFSYATLLYARFIMPNCAAVGLEIEAKQFGSSIPTRSYEVYGKCDMKIPSNYDPHTRQYTGVWDGTWQIAWTDNPAWVYYDLATNERYGLGQWIKEANIDKWALYEVAKYCDEPVPDGYGNYEPRWTCNCILQTREEAFHLLNAFASAFVGMAYWASGMVTFAQDRPSDPTHIVCGANALDANFNYSGTAISSRASVILVTWNDPVNKYEANIEVVEDPEMIQEFGWQQKDVMAVGCTRRSQAIRYGRYILYSEKYAPEIVTFQAGFDFADCAPGNIVKVADPAYAGVRSGGRLKSRSTTTLLKLDQSVTLNANETYTVTVTLPSGKPAEVVVSNAAGETSELSLATALAETPQAEAIWVLSGSSCAPRLFRVTANRETEPGKFEISAVYHNPAKFGWIYADVPIPDTHESILPTGPMPQVSSIGCKEFTFSDGANFSVGILLSWEHPKISGTTIYDPRVNHYEVQYQRSGGEWVSLGDTAQPSYEWRGIKIGAYNFRVRAIGLGAGAWGYLEGVSLTGPTDDLPIISGLEVKGGGTQFTGPDAEIVWTFVRGIALFPEGRFLNYRVDVKDSTGTTTWRTEYVTEERYVYTFEKNAKDNSGKAKPSFQVHVRAQDIFSNIAGDAYISVSNPAPSMASVTLSLTALYTGFKIDWVTYSSNATDLQGFVIRADGNNPPQTILASVGGNSSSYFQAVNSGMNPVSFYVSVTPVDVFEGGREGTKSIVGTVAVDPRNVLASLVSQLDTSHFTTSLKDEIDSIPGHANSISVLQTSLATARTDINKTVTDLTAEVANRTTGDANLQALIDELGIDFDDAHAEIVREIIVRTDADSALSALITTLTATVSGHTSQISTEQIARADGDTALAGQINTLSTTVDGHTTTINNEATARSDGDTALAGQISTLSTKVDNNTSAISSETTARTNADTAIAARTSSLETTVGNHTAAITAEQTARANADSALSNSLTTLNSTVSGHTASISSLQTAYADADLELAAKIDELSIDHDGAHAAISTEQLVRSSAIAAEYDGTQTYSIGATVLHGGVLYRCTTGITTAESWNPVHWTKVATGLYAQYTMKLDVYGNVVGISMANDGEHGQIIMMADTFAILDPNQAASAATYKKAPFIVGKVGGQTLVGINGDLLVDGTIKARMLAAEEIISSSAQIKDGIIANAHIANLNASKITAGDLSVDRIVTGSIVTGKLTVNAATASWAATSSSTSELSISVTLTVGTAVLVIGKCASATYVQNQALDGRMALYRGSTKIDSSTAMIGFYSAYGTFVCLAVDAPGTGTFTYKVVAEANLALLKDAVIQVVELRR
ncbi:MAG: phage tail protein [Desulfobacteraceae bacterium]|nr:phage tail protein [Desulfobacteraceae bacterium]